MTVETAFRRTVDTAFHQAVAFGTLSLVGTLASLPLLTLGPAVLGVAHAVATLYRRGSQHTVGDTLSLFRSGFVRYRREGAVLTLFVLLLAGAAAADVALLLGGHGAAVAVVLVGSLLLLLASALVGMHAVALVVFGASVATAARDAAVLLVQRPGATLLQGSVVASLVVLSGVTMVGWPLVGFAATVAFSVGATDRLYEAAGETSPLYQ